MDNLHKIVNIIFLGTFAKAIIRRERATYILKCPEITANTVMLYLKHLSGQGIIKLSQGKVREF